MPELTKISEHVYWLPPGPPDRPSLCAVVGERRTLMLDAGSSQAHTSEFLRALAAEGVRSPFAVVYTHSHWDHVFGGVAVGAPIVAHASTAVRLVELAAMDWSDEGLERRLAAGEASREHVEDVRQEMPAPRVVQVAPADLVFHDRVDFDLGTTSVSVRHVGGDHCAESSVMYVEPDRLLFLGDCTSASPRGALTPELAFPLYETILGFGAERFVEGHHSSVVSNAEMKQLTEKMHAAARGVADGTTIAPGDEDTAYYVEAFEAGRSTS